MTSIQIEGGCFCGAIRYRIGSKPDGSMICHCRTCRRLFSAPVVAWLSVDSGSFEFIHGKPATFSTSAPVTRWFCAACGTHVAYVHADEPTFIEVVTCSLDDPSEFPPTHHSWLGHDLAWVAFGDDLPVFPESRH